MKFTGVAPMKFKRRTRKVNTTRLSCELLEQRTVPTITFGFTTVGPDLFFDITGDDDANQVLLGRNAAGNVVFQGATDFDADGTFDPFDVEASGEVTSDDIGLAQFLTGTTFRGFRVFTLGGND